MTWSLSSSSDRRALDVVDGAGMHAGSGPHYSRRTPGAKTFTGIGQEVVLVTDCGRAVWAVTLQKGPDAPFSGWKTRHLDLFKPSREPAPRRERRAMLWRNIVFRNLGAGLSSDLIRAATEGDLPAMGQTIRRAPRGEASHRGADRRGALDQSRLLLSEGGMDEGRDGARQAPPVGAGDRVVYRCLAGFEYPAAVRLVRVDGRLDLAVDAGAADHVELRGVEFSSEDRRGTCRERS